MGQQIWVRACMRVCVCVCGYVYGMAHWLLLFLSHPRRYNTCWRVWCTCRLYNFYVGGTYCWCSNDDRPGVLGNTTGTNVIARVGYSEC